jgi:hypothetical protein
MGCLSSAPDDRDVMTRRLTYIRDVDSTIAHSVGVGSSRHTDSDEQEYQSDNNEESSSPTGKVRPDRRPVKDKISIFCHNIVYRPNKGLT